MNPIKNVLILILCLACFQTAYAGWTKQNSGTLAWLRSVYFINENKGWIAGSNGTFLTTADGGETWKPNKKITEDNIREVNFSDLNNGWILCERNIYGSGAVAASYLMKTADGGETWEKINFPEGRERVASIFFSKDGGGFAVGESGAFFALGDDKKTWKKSALPVRYLMLDGKFTDDFHAAIVGGGNTILFTDDGGLTWNPASTDTNNAAAKLNSIFFVNQKDGWTTGEKGKILFTNNGGKLWHEQNSNVSKNLSDIFFINTAEGWAIGDDGIILHTTTAGNTWNAEETGVKHKLEKVFFAGQKGFAVGFGGTILVYGKKQSAEPVKRPPQLQKRTVS